MRIAVLGVGLIGGSIGLAARAADGDARVVGHDPDEAAAAAGLERGAIQAVAGSAEEAAGGADVVFACAPVSALPDLLARSLAATGPQCVVTDVGSTKAGVAGGIDDERYIGGHPIAGAESAGVEHARADLFDGAPWYLTPHPRSSGLLYERLHRLLAGFGARPQAIDAEAHDRLLAAVSHLPHVLANVLVAQAARTVSREDEPLPRVGPSFRDATRVAGASSSIWTDIYVSNGPAIADQIDAAVERLGEIARSLRAADAAEIARWNDSARDDRRRLLEAELEGGPVHEVRASVPNRPGIVAQVALALGRAGVNIVDMALAPAPDGRSGAISLWVAGAEEAERTRALIDELGFPAVILGS